MSLSSLIYSPLKEEDKTLTGWSKSTIEYVTKNRNRVYTSIRGIAKSINNKILQRTDVEDIYMEIINYLYQCDDYNISKAYERSSNVGVIVSLEGYVHSCIKFCVIRYVTNTFKEEKQIVRDIITEDDKELSLFDTIADKSKTDAYTDMQYNLDTVCKAYEHQRYAFGPDIFQLWFIRLQTIVNNKQDKYKDILTILGVSKKEILKIEKAADTDGAMISIAKAITLIGVEEALQIIKNYTYSADKIQQVIELF